MNRGRKIKQMRKFINEWGAITHEMKLPPNPLFRPYRKGSYRVVFDSQLLDVSISCGDIDKYRAYKGIVQEINKRIPDFLETEALLVNGIQI